MRSRPTVTRFAPLAVWLCLLAAVFGFAVQASLEATWTSVNCRRAAGEGECVFRMDTLVSATEARVPLSDVGGSYVETEQVAWRPHFRLWMATRIGAVPITSYNEDEQDVAFVSHRVGQFLRAPVVSSLSVTEDLPWGTWTHAVTAVVIVLLFPLAWGVGAALRLPIYPSAD